MVLVVVLVSGVVGQGVLGGALGTHGIELGAQAHLHGLEHIGPVRAFQDVVRGVERGRELLKPAGLVQGARRADAAGDHGAVRARVQDGEHASECLDEFAGDLVGDTLFHWDVDVPAAGRGDVGEHAGAALGEPSGDVRGFGLELIVCPVLQIEV